MKSFMLLICALWFTTLSGQYNKVSANQPGQGRGLQVVYAINAGGKRHTDVYGILYETDPSNDGVASDFGMRMNINRVHPNDEILYQTERYSHSTFGYDIPVKDDGTYVLVLKFSEVYFRMPGQKIFDVILNKEHIVVPDLDIYGLVGYANAHDEVIQFHVTDHGKKLIVGTTSSVIKRSRIRLDFVKGAADNPKVNAFYVAKGTFEDVPKLPTTQEEYEAQEEDEYLYGDDDEEDIQFARSDLGYEHDLSLSISRKHNKNIRSGPAGEDPWADEPFYIVMLPIATAFSIGLISFVSVRFVIKKL